VIAGSPIRLPGQRTRLNVVQFWEISEQVVLAAAFFFSRECRYSNWVRRLAAKRADLSVARVERVEGLERVFPDQSTKRDLCVYM